jgi:hypothetical protein
LRDGCDQNYYLILLGLGVAGGGFGNGREKGSRDPIRRAFSSSNFHENYRKQGEVIKGFSEFNPTSVIFHDWSRKTDLLQH